MTPPVQANPHTEVPQLRPDLELLDVGYDATGEPGFVIHDPIRHKYFRLSRRYRTFVESLSLKGQADRAMPATLQHEEIEDVVSFLTQSRLVMPGHGAAQSLHEEYQRTRKSLLSRLAHGYLMFRVPLFNPEKMLDALLPYARLLASKIVLVLIILCAIMGIHFASRQWDHFTHTFLDSISLQGAVLFSVALVGVKVLHEMGHGLVARHYGVRVPTMGVSFMVLVPMLYTEASDAWRLSSRRQRFMIGAAGVMVELSLAAVALLLWSFLPDGPWRSAAFFVATTAWIMSLAVNLSPFMRFDGYHMLVDASGMQNIGPRAFALAQWHLRELLFKPDLPPPEVLPKNTARALIAFAWGTWIYRLTLFLGIAWLVYTMFPKAAGIPLAWVEIQIFILKPIIHALKEWNAMGWRNLLTTRRSMLTLSMVGCLVILSVLPLQRSVSVPAVLLPGQEARLFAPEPAQVIAIVAEPGAAVKQGDVLVRLLVPEIAHQQRLAQLRLEIVDLHLNRLASDAIDLAQSRVLKRERDTLLEELSGLRDRIQRLVIRAPFDGVLTGRVATVLPGQWVGLETQLAHLIAHSQPARIEGLMAERDSGRLKQNTAAVFIPEDGVSQAVDAHVLGLGIPGGEGLALSYLAAEAGGPIAMAQAQAGQNRKPLNGHIPVFMSAAQPAPDRAIRGTATVEVEPQSFAALAFGRFVTVFLRESGF